MRLRRGNTGALVVSDNGDIYGTIEDLAQRAT
jgi:hypothetical protein